MERASREFAEAESRERTNSSIENATLEAASRKRERKNEEQHRDFDSNGSLSRQNTLRHSTSLLRVYE